MPEPDNTPTTTTNSASEWKSPRTYLAVGIPLVCITCIFTMAFMILHDPGDKESNPYKKEVMNVLLPLAGTWIGTILAFYFSRDNFVAASQSVRELAATVQAGPSVASASDPAKDKMIPLAKIKFPEDDSNPDLLAFAKALTAGDRVPILAKGANVLRFIIHRSLIDRYAVDHNVQSVLLNDFLSDGDLKRAAESFGICPEVATLAEVKDTMYRIPDCQDVFLTQTGSKTEPVIGWITNVILQNNLKA